MNQHANPNRIVNSPDHAALADLSSPAAERGEKNKKQKFLHRPLSCVAEERADQAAKRRSGESTRKCLFPIQAKTRQVHTHKPLKNLYLSP